MYLTHRETEKLKTEKLDFESQLILKLTKKCVLLLFVTSGTVSLLSQS